MDAKRNVVSALVPVDPVSVLECDKAFAFLRDLVDFDEVEREHPSRGNAESTTSVVDAGVSAQFHNLTSVNSPAISDQLSARRFCFGFWLIADGFD